MSSTPTEVTTLIASLGPFEALPGVHPTCESEALTVSH